jgi:hypothetical protein
MHEPSPDAWSLRPPRDALRQVQTAPGNCTRHFLLDPSRLGYPCCDHCRCARLAAGAREQCSSGRASSPPG